MSIFGCDCVAGPWYHVPESHLSWQHDIYLSCVMSKIRHIIQHNPAGHGVNDDVKVCWAPTLPPAGGGKVCSEHQRGGPHHPAPLVTFAFASRLGLSQIPPARRRWSFVDGEGGGGSGGGPSGCLRLWPRAGLDAEGVHVGSQGPPQGPQLFGFWAGAQQKTLATSSDGVFGCWCQIQNSKRGFRGELRSFRWRENIFGC